MWILLNDAMFSIVDKKAKGTYRPNRAPAVDDILVVRARVRGDIERVFGPVKVRESESTDYRFRAEIKRASVALVIAERIGGINYGNFKDSVEDDRRYHTYSAIWSVHHRWQQQALLDEERAGGIGIDPPRPALGATKRSPAGKAGAMPAQRQSQKRLPMPRGPGRKTPLEA
jgi:hypothetical protein